MKYVLKNGNLIINNTKGNASFEIFTISGQQFYSKHIDDNCVIKIDLGQFFSRLYLLSLKKQNSNKAEKIFIE